MNPSEKLQERIQLFKNSVRPETPNKRIPHIANMWSWKFYDQQIPFQKAMTDYDVLAQSFRNFLDKYPCDAIEETGWRNPVIPRRLLGNDEYLFSDDNPYSVAIKDTCFFEPEDYDALIADPEMFIWHTLAPRKYPVLAQENNKEQLAQFLAAYGDFGKNCGNIAGICTQEYGLPPLTDSVSPFGMMGYEVLFSYIRGIKGLSVDLRRCPGKVLDACAALESYLNRNNAKAEKYHGSCPTAAFDVFVVPIGHVILSRKQFEKFYQPSLKRLADYAAEYDKILYIFAEGDNTRFYDYFRDIPAGHAVFFPELDDPYAVKRELPNVTPVAGSTVSALYDGTVQDSVDEAKRIIDDLGYDGKLIFSENKMMSFPQDAKAENLKAVADFVATYERG